VLIGEIILNQEPRITLYAESPIPVSREGIAILKDKLVNLLDTRFRQPSRSRFLFQASPSRMSLACSIVAA